MNKYLSIIALATLANWDCEAQPNTVVPRLVVSITVDQLNSDDMEQFVSLYGHTGFKKLLKEGTVYENARFDFSPLDLASAITAVGTGASPVDNGIPAKKWLSRENLRPVQCTFDKKFFVSPNQIKSSTIADQLKLATNGSGLVYSVAADCDAAVLQGGHAADGVFWIDQGTQGWRTSAFYPKQAQTWLNAYQRTVIDNDLQNGQNQRVSKLAIDCVNDHAMGRDGISDLLLVTLSAKANTQNNSKETTEAVYRNLDNNLSDLIEKIEYKVGKENVVFIVTGTGYVETHNEDYEKYNIPSGTFYINRTANLLNMYLNAIYGENRIVDGAYHNEIYLNKTLLERKRISLSKVLTDAREFLVQSSGVKEVYTADQLLFDNNLSRNIKNAYHHNINGDILIKVAPGWKIYNEETKEEYIPSSSFIPFPIIIYGAGVKAQNVSVPVTTDRIAPTIARLIRIRAPNACVVLPLP